MNLDCGCRTRATGGVPALRTCPVHSELMALTDVLLVALAKSLANQGQSIYDVWFRRAEYQVIRSASRNDRLSVEGWALLAVVAPDSSAGGGAIRS